MSDFEYFSEEESRDAGSNCANRTLIKLLQNYQVLFNKSQTPAIKDAKTKALQELHSNYVKFTRKDVTVAQLKKKLQNMKNDLKKKSNINAMGIKTIPLKDWEKMFLEIILENENPLFDVSMGTPEAGLFDEADSEGPPAKRLKVAGKSPAELDETKDLSNSQLQRLVLLEQLNLIRIQTEEAKIEDELLIESVKQKPELYDPTNRRYNDNAAKRDAWKDISSQIIQKPYECKKRWESLRAQHRRVINRQKSGEAATSKVPKWRYEDEMLFLKEFRRNSRPSVVENEETEEDYSDRDMNEDSNQFITEEKIITDPQHVVEIEVPQNVPKQPREAVVAIPNESVIQAYTLPPRSLPNSLIQRKGDEDGYNLMDSFFSLMASTVKNFNQVDQNLIKTKIFQLVSEMELKYILQNQNPYESQRPQQTLPRASTSPEVSQYSIGSSASFHQIQGIPDQQS